MKSGVHKSNEYLWCKRAFQGAVVRCRKGSLVCKSCNKLIYQIKVTELHSEEQLKAKLADLVSDPGKQSEWTEQAMDQEALPRGYTQRSGSTLLQLANLWNQK